MNPRARSQDGVLELARAVIRTEAAAAAALEARISADFLRAIHLILACRGRVVVLGMGKSGHVGGKLAATLASTGTPAFFVHPGEASHGDLGMLTAADVALALSNSGETGEVLLLLPLVKRLGIPLIALTGRPDSTLARAADVNLDVSVDREACPLGLAPTASTTAALVMGDALAVALLDARGFSADDFARSHPGGTLGRRLLLRVGDIAHRGAECPRVRAGQSLVEGLLEMTQKGLGMTVVVAENDPRQVLGVFTDGDLRRVIDRGQDVRVLTMRDVLTPGGRSVGTDALAAEALNQMQEWRVNALLVLDESGQLEGVLSMHDLLRAGVV
ncbi:MAG TPA: D-arabinose 5-phosphate isomerase [Gammaproteobacteria bacterium]|nr:D-arabinose 5-phosphate isomerase [Gammaproteobacteria bacterium]